MRMAQLSEAGRWLDTIDPTIWHTSTPSTARRGNCIAISWTVRLHSTPIRSPGSMMSQKAVAATRASWASSSAGSAVPPSPVRDT